jgi:hypothetical protein
VLDHATQEVGWIDLTLGCVLDPGDEDVDQEERKEKLESIGLDCSAVLEARGVKLSGNFR